jgi:hypothetical protein
MTRSFRKSALFGLTIDEIACVAVAAFVTLLLASMSVLWVVVSG